MGKGGEENSKGVKNEKIYGLGFQADYFPGMPFLLLILAGTQKPD